MKRKSNISALVFKFLIVYLTFFPAILFSQVNLVTDGGFEAGMGSGNWIESSTNFGTPLCDLAGCGNGTGTGPHSGDIFAWFGGMTNGIETGSLTQTLTIPASYCAQLTFYLEQITCDSPMDFLDVTIDGNVVFHTDGGSALCGILGYSLQIVDISLYADGTPHTLEFFSTTFSQNLNGTNFFVDDIAILNGTTGAYNLVKGTLINDMNGNSVFDIGELAIPHKPVQDIITGNTTFTNSSGNYTLPILDTGNFSVTADPIIFYNLTPIFIPVTFNGFGNVDSNNLFFFQPTAAFNDLRVSIAPQGAFRSGFDAHYIIYYSNQGTIPLSPTITFNRDLDITYSSSSLTPSLVTLDSVQWTPGILAPFQTGQINVTVHLATGLPINTLVNSMVSIEPIIGDANPADNYNNWEVFTTGSFDPNDISVSRESIFTNEVSNPPFLNYMIRFQNTGNDTAFTVRVTNKFLPELNFGSFELIGTSHDVELSFNPQTHIMEFLYNNILLPDSNINEPASHGFINYRIKPVNTLSLNDSILNRADIYFDFNLPVSTNIAVTKIISPVGMNELAGNQGSISAFPNPVKDEITVVVEAMKGKHITLGLYDVYGRMVKFIYDGLSTSENFQVKSGLNTLNGGIYFVRLESGMGSQNLKIVKY